MDNGMSDGWDKSAQAWIASMGEVGDWSRRHVLDPVMLDRVACGGFERALDIGCGEGRFCRAMAGLGIRPTGVDPTEALLARARELDPAGDYRLGRAEALDFPNGSFDLVVSYLSLMDVADIARAIPEMARVLTPGGTLLIAQMSNFNSAGAPRGWVKDAEGRHLHYPVDNYLDESDHWAEWHGMRIRSWHRPLSTYMSLLLDQGLILRRFLEPAPVGGEPEDIARYRRAPYFMVTEWQKPEVSELAAAGR
jgi:SAM-dependent methyltransferase